MKKKRSGLAVNSILMLLSLVFLIPFVYLVSISLSNNTDLSTYGYSLIPKNIDFSAYKLIAANPEQIIDAYWVTTFSSVVGTFLGVLIMAMVAYPLSRNTFIFRNIIMAFIFFTMLFGGGLIPTYILMTRYLGLGNNIWVYIANGLINAFHIIVLRTFFQGMPLSVLESAKIDGASEFQIFFKILLPLSKPVLATVALITLLTRWNDWTTTLIYIRDGRLYTLQFLLQKILREAEFVSQMAKSALTGNFSGVMYELPAESMRFAMVIVTSGPMLVVFPFFQKYFAKGLTVGAVKG